MGLDGDMLAQQTTSIDLAMILTEKIFPEEKIMGSKCLVCMQVHSPHEIICTMGKNGQDAWQKQNHAEKYSSISVTNQCQISSKMYQ